MKIANCFEIIEELMIVDYTDKIVEHSLNFLLDPKSVKLVPI